jgi:hypothetical protein
VTRNDVAEQGTVISFTGGEQVYIVVNEQPEEPWRSFLDDLGMFHGASYMKLRRYFPVMLGEYWVYLLAGIISITTLILLYSHSDPIGKHLGQFEIIALSPDVFA